MSHRPKTVLMLLNNEFINDNRVLREAQTLMEEGCHVELLCTQRQQSPLAQKENINGLIVRRLLHKRLNTYRASSLRHWKALITALINFKRPDIIHVHDVNMLWLGQKLSCFWNRPFIYDSHEYWASLVEHKINQLKAKSHDSKIQKEITDAEAVLRLEKKLVPQCAGLISVNQSILDEITHRAGHSPNNQIVLRNIPDVPADIPANEKRFHAAFNLPAETKIVLFQGGYSEERGILKLAEAMRHLCNKPYALVIMGNAIEDNIDDKLSALIAEINQNSESVIFKQPAVLPNELLAWTASADVGVVPFLNTKANHYFCLPNKFFEYLHAGIPIAASAFPEMRKLIDDHHIGATFTPENPEDIARVLDVMLHQDFTPAIAKAREELTWTNEKQALLNLYQAINTK